MLLKLKLKFLLCYWEICLPGELVDDLNSRSVNLLTKFNQEVIDGYQIHFRWSRHFQAPRKLRQKRFNEEVQNSKFVLFWFCLIHVWNIEICGALLKTTKTIDLNVTLERDYDEGILILSKNCSRRYIILWDNEWI